MYHENRFKVSCKPNWNFPLNTPHNFENRSSIKMSHWHQQMVDGADHLISCHWLAFLSAFSHLQLIQNSAPSTICWVSMWHPNRLSKYGSQEKIPFWCRCSTLLGPTFVEIKKSFTETLLTFKSKNFKIICYWKRSDESAAI